MILEAVCMVLCVCRLELESKVHELEKQRVDLDTARLDAAEKAEERVKKAMEQKDVAERETLVMR